MNLYKAVEKNNIEEVRKLLDHNHVHHNHMYHNHGHQRVIDVNERGANNNTPLHVACEKGSTDIVRILLKHKEINVNLVGQYYRTPLMWACIKGHTDIVKILLEDGRSDVNLVDGFSSTSLMWTCFNGHVETVRELINCLKVDLFLKTTKDYIHDNITYKAGLTALDIAKTRGHYGIVKMLEDKINKKLEGTISLQTNEKKKKKEEKKKQQKHKNINK